MGVTGGRRAFRNAFETFDDDPDISGAGGHPHGAVPFRKWPLLFCFFGAVISAALIVAVFIFESFDEFFSFIIFRLLAATSGFLCVAPRGPRHGIFVFLLVAAPLRCVSFSSLAGSSFARD